MKAMILAAGRGERLRPLTDTVPKPLLEIGGKPIIQHTIEALAKSGFKELIINLAYLGGKIESTLGNGDKFGVNIEYSHEGETGLETAGGIIHALAMLGSEPFLVVNGDIATDFVFSELYLSDSKLAHVVLVPNPSHHRDGDFTLEDGAVSYRGDNFYTYSGIGLFRAEIFEPCNQRSYPLAPLLRLAMDQQAVSGQLHKGYWMDIGTIERLELVDRKMTLDNAKNNLKMGAGVSPSTR